MAAVRLHRIKAEYEDAVRIDWRSCPLAIEPRPEARISEHSIEGRQRAALEEEGIIFNDWDPEAPYITTSMPALRAAACARLQGEEMFTRLHLTTFKAFFEDCRCIDDEKLLFNLAKEAGCDMKKFRADYRHGVVDATILADHRYYQENYAGWGIPLALINDRYPVVGGVPIEMYRRAVDLSLGKKPK